MDVNPNIAKGSDELSLTIGDITSLFVQQMEPVDREGVHSPEAEVTDDPMLSVVGQQLDSARGSEDDPDSNTQGSLDDEQPCCSYKGQGQSDQSTSAAETSEGQITTENNEGAEEESNIDL